LENNFTMKNSLDFNIPFSGMSGLNFPNCLASAHMFVEKMDLSGLANHPCKVNPKNVCSGCGSGCGDTPASMQGKYFFLFDTMCGHSSLRWRFDNAPNDMQRWITGMDLYECGTDDTIDFLFGFAGHEYRKLATPAEFKPAIIASIHVGKPVIAKVKNDGARFRVIIGHDNDALLEPDYANAQHKPSTPATLGELETLWVFGEKIAPRYTLKHGLERIAKVMEYNLNEAKLWDAYLEKIGWYGWSGGDPNDGMNKADKDEKKRRMKRVAEIMWHTFNTHNFAEVFRARHYEELRDPVFDELCRKIGYPLYGYTHDLAAGLIGMEQQLNWDNDWFATGFSEITQLTLFKIKEHDIAVLDAVKQMLEILRQREGR